MKKSICSKKPKSLSKVLIKKFLADKTPEHLRFKDTYSFPIDPHLEKMKALTLKLSQEKMLDHLKRMLSELESKKMDPFLLSYPQMQIETTSLYDYFHFMKEPSSPKYIFK